MATTRETQEYVVLLHGDETTWLTADDAARARAYEEHGEFSRLCEAHGHRVTGGAELAPSSTSRVVRRGDDGAPVLSEGPYAETVEQLGGYDVIETADVEDLARLVVLVIGSGAAEIRPVVPAPTSDATDHATPEGPTSGDVA